MDVGKTNLSISKIETKNLWDPKRSLVEKLPHEIVLGRGSPKIMATPHWHAQIEINFVSQGKVSYEMCDVEWTIPSGCIALFWGGLPHRLTDCTINSQMEAIHLPLVHFFRLRLPDQITGALMQGSALITSNALEEDIYVFKRWCSYLRSDDERKKFIAAEELLLRLERIPLDSFNLIEMGQRIGSQTDENGSVGFEKLGQMLEFITRNFREDIDPATIAEYINLHPKYAMSVFKKSTGMTLNNYVKLLRLSYAQSLLLGEGDNILDIAMESGFGSLSHFNKCFRNHVGMSPSDFKKQSSLRRVQQ